jgi:hypothetical protein
LSEFTYFGKTYFDEALRAQNSFVEGFYVARQSIFERERKEDLSHSFPQIWIGSAIVARLETLESRLGGFQKVDAGE